VRLAARLVLGTIGVLLFSVLILIWAFRASLRSSLERSMARSLEEQAVLIRDALPEDLQAWDPALGRIAVERNLRITMIDARGVALANIGPPGQSAGPSLSDLPEVRAALRGEKGVARRGEDGRPAALFVAVPGDPIVRLASDLSPVAGAVRAAQRSILWAAFLALLAGSTLALVGGRAAARPLRELARTARAIPAGEPLRLPRSSVVEIEELGRALRETAHELALRYEAVSHGRAESATLVEAMVEGVLATNRRGRIVTANPGARRLLGYGPSEPLPDLPHLFRVKAAREVVEATMRGEVVQDRELELDGRVVSVNSRPLAAGGAVLVLHDLTRLRQLEAVRRDFIANVSHELKTPLTSIAGYAETLLTEDPDPETRRRFLRTLLDNARRMQQLVEDQLSLARVESGRWQPQLEPVEVTAAAREAWAQRASNAEAANVRFQADVRPGADTLLADPEAIQQILGNLFDNAIRYSPAGGLIVCRAEPVEDGVLLSVSDTGTGIATEHLPRIFERYYRADVARSRDAGGTGLGLAIVKHLVEAHGGKVRVESELGRGTTVGCWFPH